MCLCVLIYQADSFKMDPELVKNADLLEHLLSFSGNDRLSVDPDSKAGGQAEAMQVLLTEKGLEGIKVGDRVHQILSSVNNSGTNLDTQPR